MGVPAWELCASLAEAHLCGPPQMGWTEPRAPRPDLQASACCPHVLGAELATGLRSETLHLACSQCVCPYLTGALASQQSHTAHSPQPQQRLVAGRPHARAKVLHSREMAPPGQRGRWEPGTFARVSGGLSPWSGHLHHLQTKNRWPEGPLGSAPPRGPEATSWGRPLPAGHHCLASFVNRTVDPLS